MRVDSRAQAQMTYQVPNKSLAQEIKCSDQAEDEDQDENLFIKFVRCLL